MRTARAPKFQVGGQVTSPDVATAPSGKGERVVSTSERVLQAQLGQHLQSAGSYLLELEQAIRAFAPDSRALHNFRLAANQVRRTAWAVEQCLAEQEHTGHGKGNGNGKRNGNGKSNGNGGSAVPVIHTDLVYHALEANLALLDELETNVAAVPEQERKDLLHAISLLQKRLEHLLSQ